MALEMMKYLGQATFDFSIANKLPEKEHYHIFLIIFNDMVRFAGGDNCETINLITKGNITFSLPCDRNNAKKQNIYKFSKLSLNSFEHLAKDLYYSDEFEVEIIFVELGIRMLVCMDPVYFSLKQE